MDETARENQMEQAKNKSNARTNIYNVRYTNKHTSPVHLLDALVLPQSNKMKIFMKNFGEFSTSSKTTTTTTNLSSLRIWNAKQSSRFVDAFNKYCSIISL